MYSYDSKQNVLSISKIQCTKSSTEYKPSLSYQSYMHYINNGLLKDMDEVLVPAIDKILGGGVDRERMWLCTEKSRVVYDNTSTYLGYEYYSAFISLCLIQFINGTRPFCAIKIPFMDKAGIIHKEGKKYAVLNSMVQSNDITYEKGELKVVTRSGYINVKKEGTILKTVYRDKKYPVFQALFALAKLEGIDCYKLFSKYTSKSLTNSFRDGSKLIQEVEYRAEELIDRKEGKKFANVITSHENYRLDVVRDKINKVLSLDRAVGKMLSRSIRLSNGEVIPAESIVSQSMLKQIKLDKINELYVREVPDMIGYLLAEDVFVPFLRKGTEMLPIISDRIPDWDGMYLNRDIHFKGLGMDDMYIQGGTIIEAGLLEMLAYNGFSGVVVKPSENSEVREIINFEEEIMGNRHFKESELGISDSSKYVYVEEDGTITKPREFLCAYDLAAMISFTDKLLQGKDEEHIAARDAGCRKKIKQVAELFHEAFIKATVDFIRIVKRKIVERASNYSSAFNDPDEMEATFFVFGEKFWKILYTDMKVLTPVDMQNPVAMYSSLDKIVTITKDANSISDGMRAQTLGHYGRICPYETPSGKKLGTVNVRAILADIRGGQLYTPYYRVEHIGQESYISDEVLYLTVEEEEDYRIADILSLDVDDSKRILTVEPVFARVPAYKGLEKLTAAQVSIKNVDLVQIDPNQSVGHTATTIPFMGANDSARITFGLSMCKQAKGLLYAETPIVLTKGFIDIPRISPYFMIIAEKDGLVVGARDGSVDILYYDSSQVVTYTYEPNEFNNASIILRKLEVREGQEVKEGDVLVSSNFTKDGMLAMGKNCLVGYISVGDNYEDGVAQSERLVHNMTSYGTVLEKEPIPVSCRSTAVTPVDKFRYFKKGDNIYHLKHSSKKSKTYMDRYVKSKGAKGFVVDVSKEVDKFSKKETKTQVRCVSYDFLQEGDKLANRHGNKGVTAEPKLNTEMPFFLNGEFLDVVYNPPGVPSRMNIGQILECNLGFIGYLTETTMFSDTFNGATVDDIKQLLMYVWRLANEEDVSAVQKDFLCLPVGYREHCENIIFRIKQWKGCFNPDGTAYMVNPRTGKLFDNPAVVGINYIYKLLHESGKKINSRAGFCEGSYIEKFDAPTQGLKNHGGQKSGTMEFDAYNAYGASALIQELLNERGDNAVRRNNVTVDVLHSGAVKYKLPEDTAIRRSTEYFLNVMASAGVHVEFEGELPNSTVEENARRKVYRQSAIINAANLSTEKESKGKVGSLSDFSDELGML